MVDKIVQSVEPTESDALAGEVHYLYRDAIGCRYNSGIIHDLRRGFIRETIDDGDEGFTELNPHVKPQSDCGCTDGNTCSKCEPQLQTACTIEDMTKAMGAVSPFKGVANLLTTVKKYEFISLVENAYAQIGHKPFKFKPTKDVELSESELKKAASEFYQFVESFLDENQVRVNELPQAFNLSTMGEITEALADSAQQEADNRVQEHLSVNEGAMERIFKRSDYMREYMEVIKDTTEYPIGVMWVDDKSVKKERVIRNGKMAVNYAIQCDAKRIDPCYFWATEDWRLNQRGRAVFKLEQFTSGDIQRWVDMEITGSDQVSKDVREYLHDHTDGFRMYEAMMFDDHIHLRKGYYDVLISRGMYNAVYVKERGIKIPDSYKNESYIPCEIYYSAGKVLRCRVMEVIDDNLGVFTTVFRRRGQSIFGYSLHDFIYAFAKLYEGAVDAIDRSMNKATGSIIQVDTGVLNNPDAYIRKDEETGEITLDLTDDLVIEFDSTQAFSSPNFKGVPIHVDQLPSDLAQLLPVVDFVFDQLEKISGIPSILVNSQNVSSALRTTGNFNASFAASSKGVKSLLREGENRVLEPSVRYIFDNKAMTGEMGEFLTDLEPEILLSDTLTREVNEDNDLVQGVISLSQLGGGLIPPDKLSGLINTVGREVYNLNEDLIPGAGVLSTVKQPTPVAPV